MIGSETIEAGGQGRCEQNVGLGRIQKVVHNAHHVEEIDCH
jgi:hypothetical protein